MQRHSGTLKTVVELAAEYGFTDVTGPATSRFRDALHQGRDVAKETATDG